MVCFANYCRVGFLAFGQPDRRVGLLTTYDDNVATKMIFETRLPHRFLLAALKSYCSKSLRHFFSRGVCKDGAALSTKIVVSPFP
jgi:hypothetical protein